MKKYNQIYSRISAMNTVEENGKIWFSLLNRNGICEIDRESWQAKICMTFEDEPLNKSFLYTHVEKINNNLIFSPGMAKKIAIYNLEHGSIKYIPLKPLKKIPKESQKEIKFWNTFRYQSYIYLFGYSYPAIIRIDINSLEVRYFTDWVEEIEKNISVGDDNGYFSDGYTISDNHALIPIGCMKAILELNLKTGDTKIESLEISMQGIGGISSINGETIWLVGRGKKANHISCWNRKTNFIKEFFLTDLDESIADPFYAPICTNTYVFLMPMSGPYIYQIDIFTDEIKKCNILKRQFKNNRIPLPWWKIMSARLNGDWLEFLTCDDTKWQEYNVVTGEYKSHSIYFKENRKEQESYFGTIYEELVDKNELILEEKIPLSFFINEISHSNINNSYKKSKMHLIGDIIYQKIDFEGK